MRNLQTDLSTFGNLIVRSIQLIVSGEDLRSLGVNSLTALRANVSRLYADCCDTFWQWLRPSKSWACTSWATPRLGAVSCFATVKQRQRRHEMCHRTAR